MTYCLYYQAFVKPEECWYVVATLRSHEHLVFDRTLSPEQSIFEFFVAPGFDAEFNQLMHYYQERGLVRDLKALPNRLVTEEL